MRTRLFLFPVLLWGAVASACATKHYAPIWPSKGSVVYVSRTLFPGPAPSSSRRSVDYPDTRSTAEIARDSIGGSPGNASQELPPCEPVEVCAVRRHSLCVRDGQGRGFDLSGEWKSIVHTSASDCQEKMHLAKRPQSAPAP